MEIGTENSSLVNSALWKLLAFPKYPKERVTGKRKYTFPVMDFIPGYSLPLQYGGTSLHTAENFVPFQDCLHGEKSKTTDFLPLGFSSLRIPENFTKHLKTSTHSKYYPTSLHEFPKLFSKRYRMAVLKIEKGIFRPGKNDKVEEIKVLTWRNETDVHIFLKFQRAKISEVGHVVKGHNAYLEHC